jgi:hypothetical protein
VLPDELDEFCDELDELDAPLGVVVLLEPLGLLVPPEPPELPELPELPEPEEEELD